MKNSIRVHAVNVGAIGTNARGSVVIGPSLITPAQPVGEGLLAKARQETSGELRGVADVLDSEKDAKLQATPLQDVFASQVSTCTSPLHHHYHIHANNVAAIGPIVHSDLSTRSDSPRELTFNIPRQWLFISRPAMMKRLLNSAGAGACSTSSLQRARKTVTIVLLLGMGGIGKSQLALWYATASGERNALPAGENQLLSLVETRRYRLRGWFNAGNATELQSSYYQFATQTLQLPYLREDTPSTDVIRAVASWLHKENSWLLVFDNAHCYRDIEPYLVSLTDRNDSQQHHIIITSRQQDWPHSSSISVVDVDERMEEDEAIAFVKALMAGPADSSAFGGESSDTDLSNLVRVLLCYPLALSQAGAYLHKRPTVSVAQYTQQHEHHLVNNRLSPTGDIFHQTVAHTFDISISDLVTVADEENIPPLARMLLTVASFLNPDGVPLSLLKNWVLSEYPDAAASRSDLFDILIGMLRDYSLIRLHVADKTISIHRVLQMVVRNQFRGNRGQGNDRYYPHLTVDWYVRLMEAVQMDSKRESARGLAAVSHLESVEDHYYECFLPDPQLPAATHPLALGKVLYEHGRVLLACFHAKAHEVLLRALSVYEKHPSEHNSEGWIDLLFHVGLTFFRVGQFEQSLRYLQEARAVHERQLGKWPLKYIQLLKRMDYVHNKLGHFEESSNLCEKVLELTIDYHGTAQHLEVAALQVEVGETCAYFQGEQNDLKRRTLYCSALTFYELYLDAHKDVVSSAVIGNMIRASNRLNKSIRRKDIYLRRLQEALKEAEDEHGKHSPAIIQTLLDLSNCHVNREEYDAAITALQRALNVILNQYVPDHVQVANLYDRQASVFKEWQQYHNEQDCLQKALHIFREAYGNSNLRVLSLQQRMENSNSRCANERRDGAGRFSFRVGVTEVGDFQREREGRGGTGD